MSVYPTQAAVTKTAGQIELVFAMDAFFGLSCGVF